MQDNVNHVWWYCLYYLLYNIIRGKKMVRLWEEQKFVNMFIISLWSALFLQSVIVPFSLAPSLTSFVTYPLIFYLQWKGGKKVSFPVPSTFCCCWHASVQISSLSAVLIATNHFVVYGMWRRPKLVLGRRVRKHADVYPGCTVGSLCWSEYLIASSTSTETKGSHDDLLLLAQSEMSCRQFCDPLLPSASRGHTMRTPYSYPGRGSSAVPWLPWDFMFSSLLPSLCQGG